MFVFLVSLVGIAPLATSGAAFAQAFLDASNFREEASRFEAIWSKPLEELMRLAASGDPYAQVAMGSRYMVGDGVELSFAEALHFFELSAKQGNPFGEEALGNAYYTGRGTEADFEKAFYWNRSAAMQGHPSGIYSTAAAFFFGYGTRPDPVAAFVWLSLLPPREDAVYSDMYAELENSLTEEQRDRAKKLLSSCVGSRLSKCP